MKVILVACLCMLAAAVDVNAEFKMPKRVYRMNQLGKAQDEAELKGRAISFVYSQESMSCPLSSGASLNAAEVLGRKTVVVYANCETEWAKLPPAVQMAFRSPDSGKFIPKIAILDAALTNVIAVVPYALGEEQNRLLKKAIRKLPTIQPKSGLASKPALSATALAFSIPLADNRESRRWQSASGNSVEGSLVHERNGKVTLKKKGGSTIELSSSSLGSDDQAYLDKIRDGAASALAEVDSK